MEESCFICLNDIKFFTVEYDCTHKLCPMCFSRIFLLKKDFNCQICKIQQNITFKPAITTNNSKKRKQLDKNELSNNNLTKFKKKLFHFFNSEQLKTFQDFFREIFDFKCLFCDLAFKAPKAYKTYRQHLSEQHSSHLCDICNSEQSLFSFEYKIYDYISFLNHKNCKNVINYQNFSLKFTKNAYKFVLNKSVQQNSQKHFFCSFCKKFFYDEKKLYDHCKLTHKRCETCHNNSLKHRYYENEAVLKEHLRTKHYRCMKCETVCFHKSEMVMHYEFVHGDKKTMHCIKIPPLPPNFVELKFVSAYTDDSSVNATSNIKTDKINIKTDIDTEEINVNTNKKLTNSNITSITDIQQKISSLKIQEQVTKKKTLPKISSCPEAQYIIHKNILEQLSFEEMCQELFELMEPKKVLKLVDDYRKYLVGVTDVKYKKFKDEVLFPSFVINQKSQKNRIHYKFGFQGFKK